MINNLFIKAKVIHGSKIGTTIGYPTLNLDKLNLKALAKKGVYAVKVKIKKREYGGVLYFGPRLVLNEINDIWEIYVFDYSGDLYDRFIYFKIISFIRPVINFTNLKDLEKQISEDCQKAKEILK